MNADSLDGLLRNFAVAPSLIHFGPLCGEFAATLDGDHGNVHLIHGGWADVRHEELPAVYITEPTLLFYPRPLAHWFVTDAQSGADFLCATVAFRVSPANPIVQALPPLVAVTLSSAPEMQATIDLLFAEASANRYGRKATVDRLFEVLLTQLLRKVLNDGMMSSGMLAGLAHPQLGKALVAFHDAPGQAWTLQKLAEMAGMSRSRFSQVFKFTIGETVGEYLVGWRLALAQELLRRSMPLKHVADKAGYGSPLALTRAFRSRLGVSPRDWLQSEGSDAIAWNQTGAAPSSRASA